MMPTPVSSSEPRRALAVVLWAPPLFVALALAVSGGLSASRPKATPVTASDQASFTDAIARNDARAGAAFVWSGLDPNAIVPVRHQTLTGGRVMFVSPIAWAVANHAPRSVLMLLGLGVGATSPEARLSVCLARQMGFTDIDEMLAQDAVTPPPSCPPIEDATPPLAPYDVR